MATTAAKTTDVTSTDKGRATTPESTLEGAGASPAGKGVVQRLLAAASSAEGSATITPHDVRGVQRTLGNRATSHLLQSRASQPPALQCKGGSGDRMTSHDTLEMAMDGVKGSGQPLPYLDRIQRSFGSYDLSGARSFVGESASTAARNIGAEAYTTGDSIAFRDSSPTLHTVAHEAAHVIQQREGVHLKGGVGQEGDVYERHADQVADGVVRGLSVEHLLSQGPGGSRGGTRHTGSSSSVQRSKTPVVQRIRAEDMATLYALAKLEMPGFFVLMEGIAKETKSTFKARRSLKTMDRAIDKAKESEEEQGDERVAVTGLTDIIAGSLIFDSLRDLLRGYRTLTKKLAEASAQIVRLKNRINNPYTRDFLLNIRMKSGFVVELQLHLKPTFDAKQGDPKKVKADKSKRGGHYKYTGHDAYDYMRILEPFQRELGTLSFDDIPDEDEAYEISKLRTATRFIGSDDEQDLVHLLQLEVAKKSTADKVNELGTELTALYDKIQGELMDEAWKSLARADGFAADLQTVGAIESPLPSDTDYRHDFAMARQHWQSLGKPKENELNRLTKRYGEEAKKILSRHVVSVVATTLTILQKYHRQLVDKRKEKETKHSETFKPSASIDHFITVLGKAIETLEAASSPKLQKMKTIAKIEAKKTKAKRLKAKELEQEKSEEEEPDDA